MKPKEIPLEVLRQPKTTKNDEIIPFTTTCNPNEQNMFLKIKQSFRNFQYSATMPNIFQKKELVNPLSQAANRERLPCMSKLESKQKRSQS